MRFNGTTVPNYRDNTYTTEETNRDVQTGRAVYANKDRYENDDAYKASIAGYISEGFHLIFGTPGNPSENEGGSGGGGDDGGGDDGDLILITEETITTEAGSDAGVAFGRFSYSSVIKPDSIIVTFNGTEYECPVIHETSSELGIDTYYYGGFSRVDPGQPDFSEYPFLIGSETEEGGAYNFLLTENAGTYTVKIEYTSKTPK